MRGHVQTGADAKAINTGKALGLLSSFALSCILLLFPEADVFCQLLACVTFRVCGSSAFAERFSLNLSLVRKEKPL